MDRYRASRLDAVIAEIQQRWGSDAIQPLGARAVCRVTTLPTGFSGLDALLNGGGLPQGHITEMHGSLASGVTTLAFRVLAHSQAAGRTSPVAYIDLAHAFDAEYAARCGMDLQRLLVVRPEALDDAFDISAELVARTSARLLIVDSSFEPSGSAQPPTISAAFRRMVALVRGSACAVVCLTRPQSGMVQALVQRYAAVSLHLRLFRWIRHFGGIDGCETQVSVLRQKGGGGQVRLRLSFEPANGCDRQ